MGRDRREVGHEIHVLSNMIGRKIDEEKRQRNMGDVSPVQTWVIRYLHDHKGQEICQRDLERDFNITRFYRDRNPPADGEEGLYRSGLRSDGCQTEADPSHEPGRGSLL